MDKKFCDKCKKEIRENEPYYCVNIFKELKKENEEELIEELDYCSACYKKIRF